jgi:hypothetical protein
MQGVVPREFQIQPYITQRFGNKRVRCGAILFHRMHAFCPPIIIYAYYHSLLTGNR